MYRTARAHPPSCCQVSFLLTLHLAPDLTGTRCACLFPCLLCSLCTPAHIYTCTHIIHWLRLKSFPTVGQKMEIVASRAPLRVAGFCDLWCKLYNDAFSDTHDECPGVFAPLVCTGAQVLATSSLKQRAHSLRGLRWGISLPITVARAAFEYFIWKSELWEDAEVRKYDVCLLAWERQMWSLWERRSRLNLLCGYK